MVGLVECYKSEIGLVGGYLRRCLLRGLLFYLILADANLIPFVAAVLGFSV